MDGWYLGTVDLSCIYMYAGTDCQNLFHEPKAIATSVEYLIIIGFSEAFMCVELTTVGALSGLGRTRLCSIISIAFTSARIPLSIILGGIMGLDGIWWAISSTSIVKGIIFTCTFYGSQENDGKLSKTMCVIQNSRKKRLRNGYFRQSESII